MGRATSFDSQARDGCGWLPVDVVVHVLGDRHRRDCHGDDEDEHDREVPDGELHRFTDGEFVDDAHDERTERCRSRTRNRHQEGKDKRRNHFWLLGLMRDGMKEWRGRDSNP